MIQKEMIARVRDRALADPRIDCVLMYGSFIRGEGDAWSDIEFYVFFREALDRAQWVGQVRPVLLYFTNEFGTEVAIFDNLVRGEFHFLPVEQVRIVRTWEGHTSFRHYREMMLVDKEGRLAGALAPVDKGTPPFDAPASVRWIGESALNHLLMVRGLILRGEYIHAQQNYWYLLKHLLFLMRIASHALQHWESPSKKAEADLPAGLCEAYAACVPAADGGSLHTCYRRTVPLLRRLFSACDMPADVCAVLERIAAESPGEAIGTDMP